MEYASHKLQTNSIVEVVVTHVEDPENFYCQLQQYTSLRDKMMHDIDYYSQAVSTQEAQLTSLRPGMPCLAQYKEDNAWCRAVITGIHSSGELQVQFVDYGNHDEVGRHQVRRIDPCFLSLPKQALHCHLNRIKVVAPDMWTQTEVDLFFEMATEHPVKALIVAQHDRLSVELLDGSVNLNEKFGEQCGRLQPVSQHRGAAPEPKPTPQQPNGWASWDKQPANSLAPQTARQQQFGQNEYHDVYLAYVLSPGRFWCQLAKSEANLEAMMVALNDACTKNTMGSQLQPAVGHLCCALFEDDDRWYRATILEVQGSTTALVHFVDYGNEAKVPLGNIKPIPANFASTPAYAFQCALSGVQPDGQSWSETVAIKFEEMVLDQTLVAGIAQRESDGSYVVDLVDTNKQGHPAIATELIKLGLAQSTHPMPLVASSSRNVSRHPSTGSSASSSSFQSRSKTPLPPQTDFRYLNLSFPVGQTVKVVMAHVNSPCHFWCQPASTNQQLNTVMEQLEELYQDLGSTEMKLVSPRTGQPCAAKFTTDDGWYRAEILEVGRNIKVKYVDYGNSEKLSADRIKVLRKELIELPAQAVECSLVSVKTSSWTEKEIAKFEELTFEKNLQAEVISSKDNKYDIVLVDTDSRQKINTHFPSISGGGDAGPMVHYKSPEIEPNRSFPAFIVWVNNPLDFYCQNPQFASKLQAMMESLFDFYQSQRLNDSRLEGPVPNQPCAAPYSEDGNWYRAVVQKVKGHEAQVQFIDYGNTDTVSLSRLKQLDAQFSQLPIQAIHCSLDGIAMPPQSKWPQQVASFFQKLCSQELNCVPIRQSDDKWCVSLKDNANRDIAQQLGQLSEPQQNEGSKFGSRDNDRGFGGSRDNDRGFGGSRDNDRSGGFGSRDNDRSGGFGSKDNDRSGGFGSRDNDRSGGFGSRDNRSSGFGGSRDDRSGGSRDDRSGGSRDDRSGGSRDDRSSGFKSRDDRGFGSRENDRSGGFKSRDNDRSGGFGGRQDGGDRRGFNSRDGGGQREGFSGGRDQRGFGGQDEGKGGGFGGNKGFNQQQSRSGFGASQAAASDDWGDDDTPSTPALPTPQATSTPAGKAAKPRGEYSYTADTLKPGDTKDVTFSSFESVAKFYCNLSSDSAALDEFMQKLHDHYTATGGKAHSTAASVGMPGATIFSEDNYWYRTVVTKVVSSSRIEILFVDYGNKEETDLSKVKVLDDKFISYPVQAIECCLSGLQGVNNALALAKLRQLVDDKTCKATIVGIKNHVAEVKLTADSVDITSKMCEEFGHLVTDSSAVFKPVECPTTSTSVYLTHLESPGDFYVQLADQETEVTDLADKIQENYNKEDAAVLENCKVGSACVTKFSEDDMWYRATVEKITDGKATVRFVDYGNTDVVEVDKLKAVLGMYFKTPMFAVHCHLKGLPTKHWAAEATTTFQEITEADDAELAAEFDTSKSKHHVATDISDKGVSLLEQFTALAPEVKERKQMKAQEGIQEEVDVFISHTDSPALFYVQLVSQEEELTAFSKKLDEAYREGGEQVVSLEDPQVGNACCCLFSEDDAWYRGVIENIGTTTTSVRFVDFGNAEDTNTSELKELQDDFCEQCAFAWECKIEGVEGEFTQEGKDTFDEAMNETLACKFISSEAPFQVQIKMSGENLTEKMKTFLTSARPESKIPDVDVPTEQDEVYISHTNDLASFFVQLASKSDDIETFSTNLNADYVKCGDLKLTNAEVGQICCALFSEDEAWYRAKVVQKKDGDKYEVRFIDYGNSDTVDINQLCYLKPEFCSVAPMAIHCSLNGSENADAEQLEKFNTTTQDASLVAKFLTRSTPCEVDLTLEGESVATLCGLSASTDVTDDEVTTFTQAATPTESVTAVASHPNTPAEFYIQLNAELDNLSTYMDVLNTDLTTSKQPSFNQPGGACMALYSEDEMWYRATVINTSDEGSVNVCFVDYGNSECVTQENVKKLPAEHLKKSPFAWRCTLAGVDTSREWSEDEVTQWNDLISESEFEVQFVTKSEPYEVEVVLEGEKLSERFGSSKVSAPETGDQPSLEAPVGSPERPSDVPETNDSGEEQDFDDAKEETAENDEDDAVQEDDNSETGDQPSLEAPVGSPERPSEVPETNDSGEEQDFDDAKEEETVENDEDDAVQEDEKTPITDNNDNEEEEIPSPDNSDFITASEEEVTTADVSDASTPDKDSSQKKDGVPSEETETTEDNDKPTKESESLEQDAELNLTSFRDVELYKDQRVHVYVTSVISPASFRCQLVTTSTRELPLLMDEIQDYCGNTEDEDDEDAVRARTQHQYLPQDQLTSNMPCLSQYDQDENWYRSEILELKEGSETADVCFVDYGNTEEAPRSSLQRILPSHLLLPVQSFPCCLVSVQPVASGDAWDAGSAARFQEIVANKELWCIVNKVSKLDNGRIDTVYVDLLDGTKSVAEELVCGGYATAVNEDLSVLENTSLAGTGNDVSLDSHGYMSVDFHAKTVVAVHLVEGVPHNFTCQLLEGLEENQRFEEALQTCAAAVADDDIAPTAASLSVGQALLARRDDKWHRGILTGLEDSTCKIRLVDAGGEVEVGLEAVRYVDAEQLKLPMQAVRCQLVGVEAEPWTDEAVNFFNEQVKEKELSMCVAGQMDDGWDTFLMVYLYNTAADSTGDSINAQLVEHGYAQTTADSQLECVPKVDKTQRRKNSGEFNGSGYKYLELTSEQELEVRVVSVTEPDTVLCVPVFSQEQLKSLEEEMTQTYQGTLHKITDIVIGSACAVVLPDDDTVHRAKMISMKEDGRVCVRLVDQGREVDTDIEERRHLLPSFIEQLPQQIIACQLTEAEQFETCKPGDIIQLVIDSISKGNNIKGLIKPQDSKEE